VRGSFPFMSFFPSTIFLIDQFEYVSSYNSRRTYIRTNSFCCVSRSRFLAREILFLSCEISRALVLRALCCAHTHILEKVFDRAACKVLHTRASDIYNSARLGRPSFFTYIVLFIIIFLSVCAAAAFVRPTPREKKQKTKRYLDE